MYLLNSNEYFQCIFQFLNKETFINVTLFKPNLFYCFLSFDVGFININYAKFLILCNNILYKNKLLNLISS